MRKIADRISRFKFNLFSCPYWFMIDKFNKAEEDCITFSVRPDFKVWLIG